MGKRPNRNTMNNIEFKTCICSTWIQQKFALPFPMDMGAACLRLFTYTFNIDIHICTYPCACASGGAMFGSVSRRKSAGTVQHRAACQRCDDVDVFAVGWNNGRRCCCGSGLRMHAIQAMHLSFAHFLHIMSVYIFIRGASVMHHHAGRADQPRDRSSTKCNSLVASEGDSAAAQLDD